MHSKSNTILMIFKIHDFLNSFNKKTTKAINCINLFNKKKIKINSLKQFKSENSYNMLKKKNAIQQSSFEKE